MRRNQDVISEKVKDKKEKANKRHMIKQTTTILTNIAYTFVVVAVLALALLFVGTKIDMLGYSVKVVKSGSMEPAIHTGSIVVIAPSATYSIGDVVTYGKDTKNQIPVTHRIIEKTGEGNSTIYRTKGDVNEDIDPRAVRERDVIGKVRLTIPYLGYVIEFARTPLGFAFLIGIPALVIVLDEFANIVWEVRLYRARARKQQAYRIPSRERQPRDRAPVPQQERVPVDRIVVRPKSVNRFVLDLRQFRHRVQEVRQRKYI